MLIIWMGRLCFWAILVWAVFVWAVFACGPFWDGPFLLGMTWYLGRLHLKAFSHKNFEKKKTFSIKQLETTDD